MYRINTVNGAIHCPDGWICHPPYDDEDLSHYLEYSEWVQLGNSPDYFEEEPATPVPDKVTRFQVRAALYNEGLLNQVESIMQDQSTPMLAKLAWQDAQEFDRDSNLVFQIGILLGLDSNKIDDLFRKASIIKV